MPSPFVVCAITGVFAIAGCSLQTNPTNRTNTTGGGPPGQPDGSPGCLASVPINHRPAPAKCDGGNTQPRLPNAQNECLQDSDCRQDAGIEVCSCAPETRGYAGSSVDTCVGGDCAVDSDCACGYCSPTYSPECGPFYGYLGYYCHTASDTCINDQDCDGGYCAFAPQVSHWACGYGFCAG